MERYEILRKIGDGTFGTVYLCKSRDDDSSDAKTTSVQQADKQLVAIKKMKKRYYNWDECMQLREIKALKKLHHSNIISLKEVIREENNLYLVFEHMEANLNQLIRERTDLFSETTIKHIVAQITQGLVYMHDSGFFHRDIKPENLLCRGGASLIKIGDFGLTREINSKPPFTDYVSTRWYRAPELLLHSMHYTSSVDIWALGCIASELYTLRPMFPGRGEVDQIFKIAQVLGPPSLTEWSEGERLASLSKINFSDVVPLDIDNILTGCSPDGRAMIRSILQWVPSKRPSARELSNHKFLEM